MTPLDINIDASSLSSSGCTLEWYRRVVQGYRSPNVNNDIIYGVAVHKFIDTMFQTGGDMKQARDAAYKAFRIPKYDKPKKLYMSDERHMFCTCLDYWENYVSKESTFDILQLPNGKAATELTFRFLWRDFGSVRVWLCGTMDKLGKFKRGCYAIGDYKTTSSWDEDNYFKSYEMSCQLRFYIYALKQMAIHYPDSVLGQIGATNVGAYIDALFIKAKVVENKYERSDVFQYKPEEIEEFEGMLINRVERFISVIQSIQNGGRRPNKEGILSGACERKFGKCDFWNVCKNSDPVGDVLLKRDFIIKPYDPLNFNTPTEELKTS